MYVKMACATAQNKLDQSLSKAACYKQTKSTIENLAATVLSGGIPEEGCDLRLCGYSVGGKII